MTNDELKICERFKQVREKTGLKQGEFAKKIKTTQGHVSDIENGRKNVSDRVMTIICLQFDINEEWFKTGEGQMKKQVDNEVNDIISDLLEEDNPLFDIIKGIALTYQKLDEKSQRVIMDFSQALLDNLKSED